MVLNITMFNIFTIYEYIIYSKNIKLDKIKIILLFAILFKPNRINIKLCFVLENIINERI